MIIITLTGIILSSCSYQLWFKPKSFTYLYKGDYTEIDSLIKINGYYLSNQTWDTIHDPQAPDLTQRIFYFYKDGTIANLLICQFSDDKSKKPYPVFALGEVAYYQSSPYPESIKIQSNGIYSKYTQWGIYKIISDTIKVEIITNYGATMKPGVRRINFLIRSNKELELISSNKNTGKTQPENLFSFHQITDKIDSLNNPYLKKKWFWDKETYKHRKNK